MKSDALFISLFLLFAIYCSLFTVAVAAEKWSGVDEAVIEKIAKEHGRETTGPLIDTSHGDLLLFLFLLAGAAGGFAAGYYWRTLMDQAKAKNGSKEEEKKKDNASVL